MGNTFDEALDAARAAVFNDHFDAKAACQALYQALETLRTPEPDPASAQADGEPDA